MKAYLERSEDYLRETLIPFWTQRIVDPKHGGFQTNYDRDGRRTEVAAKTLLCQARSLFALSHAIRCGFDWPGSSEMLDQGIHFLLKHFQDGEHGGYYWVCEEDGRVRDDRKIVYGHSFLIYALAEHALLTGSASSRQEAVNLFQLLHGKAADVENGGFFEHFDRQYNRVPVRSDGQYHKSFDVHMHLMEAFTTLYQLTREPCHRDALEQMMGLIVNRILDCETGVGIAVFTPDWRPIPNQQLTALWGSDRFDEKGKPPEVTSYGHNIEFAWLYLHALDTLGKPRQDGLDRVMPIFEHTWEKGVDWENGGLYVEGYRTGDVTEPNKEFWQQAEALVGFLDAYRLTADDKYLDAFRNIHDFVFGKMINWNQGEWFPLLDRKGNVLWDYMGHNWKICYHTIRAMCEIVKRLRSICN